MQGANDTGATEYVHSIVGFVPLSVTVNVCPAIVNVPVREAATVLAATSKWTVPLPRPLAPDDTLSHVSLAAAVQTQASPAETVTWPLPPLALNDCVSGEIAKVHGDFPSWRIRKGWLATINVTSRAVSAPFSSTVYRTVAGPDPLAGDCSAIQSCIPVIDHAQPAAVATSNAPEPPGGEKAWSWGATP